MSGRAYQGPPAGGGSVVLGIIRLARGRADGIRQFGATRDAFLASLAPLIALPLVGGVRMLLGGGGLGVLSDLLASLCALVAPPVLSFEIARLWGRQAAWLRFATAFNWCQWAIPLVGGMLVLVLGILAALGLPSVLTWNALLSGLAVYGLWLHWFLARHGLGLSPMRAGLMVFGVNSITVLIVLVPRMLALINGGAGLGGE
jgi:hypothetical protein